MQKYNSVIQQTFIQYTWRTTLHIIHDTNWIRQWSRWIEMSCQLFISSAFFYIFFTTFIVNIDCKNIIENLDNSTDDYNGYIQKVMILKVIQQIFVKCSLVEEKLLTVMCFFRSLISGQMFKTILRCLKGYLTRWCHRNPLSTNRYVTFVWTVKESYALCQHK